MGLLDDAIREHLELKRRRGADPSDIDRAEREALGPVRRAPEESEPADLAQSALADHGAEFEDEEEGSWAFDDSEDPFVEDDDDAFADEEPFNDRPVAAEPPTRIVEPPAQDELDEEPFDFEEEPAAAAPEPTLEPEPPAPPRRRFLPRRRREEAVVQPEPEFDESEFDEPEFDEPEAEDHAEPGAPQPQPETPPPAPAHAGQETVEYDVGRELGHDPEKPPERGGDDEDVLEETPEFLQDTPDHDRLWFEQRPPRDFDFDG
jgi:hypothetical protein